MAGTNIRVGSRDPQGTSRAPAETADGQPVSPRNVKSAWPSCAGCGTSFNTRGIYCSDCRELEQEARDAARDLAPHYGYDG